jgi:hypothetical protein
MRRTPPARIWRATFAVVGWAALALQYLLIIGPGAPGAIPGLTLNFFSYFTILTNVLAALALTAPLIRADSRLGRWSASEGVRAAIAMYIAVVGLTYHVLLSHAWEPQGLAWLTNALLHYVMPTAVVLDWLLFTPKGRLRWIDAVKWLGFPLVYVGWTLAHGYASGWWPYWFLNVPALGWAKAGFWAGVMLALFLGIGLVLVGLDRTLGRSARDSGPAPA